MSIIGTGSFAALSKFIFNGTTKPKKTLKPETKPTPIDHDHEEIAHSAYALAHEGKIQLFFKDKNGNPVLVEEHPEEHFESLA